MVAPGHQELLAAGPATKTGAPSSVAPTDSARLDAAPGDHGLRGTALTALGFLVCAGLLSALPHIPTELRPIDLGTAAARAAVVARVLSRPRMTLVEHEKKLEGHQESPDLSGPDHDSTEALAAQLEFESHREANGDNDDDNLRAIAQLTRPPPAAEAEEGPVVNRAAVVARGVRKSMQRRAELSEETQRLMQMPGAPIDNPCLEFAVAQEGTSEGDRRCVRTALDPFYATLDALVRGDEAARANMLVFGNSLIASDHVTDIVRDDLQGRFGDGGRGFLLVERLSKIAGRRVRTGRGSEGWSIRSFAQDSPFPTGVRFGFTGAMHEASIDGESTTWKLERGTRARLSWLNTGAGLTLSVDGAEVLRVAATTTAPMDGSESVEVRLPAGKELKLVAEKGARVFGVAIEREVPGVVVDTIGVPAASAQLYVEQTDPAIFEAQVAERNPTLITLMLGGNETRALGYGTTTEQSFEQTLSAMLNRLRAAAPAAACLIVTPIDAARTTTGSDELITREEIHTVIRVEKRVAAAYGCAVFDLFSAMGGVGSLARMRAGGLISRDLVHPTARGGDVLGQLFADALIKSWVLTPPPDEPLVHRRAQPDGGRPRFVGLSFPGEESIAQLVVNPAGDQQTSTESPPLHSFFQRLTELDQGLVARVAIGQFGASHTAGHMLTDRLRQRLGDRFGTLGRGFVAVGEASNRLLPSGVFRELTGTASVADGRNVVLGGALGMAGTKARLEPGAHFRMGFCQGCANSPSEDNGRLQLAWLYTPDMGTADVLLDGVEVATIMASTRSVASDVQFLSLPVVREKAILEIVARKDARPLHSNRPGVGRARNSTRQEGEELSAVGPVNLLSVTEEMDRSGVVLDAIGLSGSTGMTPQRWRQDLYAEEVKARRYDLIVTAWGTNEAGIASLDASTYRHHFGATLHTLQNASPGADCLIIGASDRFDRRGRYLVQAPNHEMVERVQRELAAEHGCAFFSLREAMGGPGSMKQWVKDGFGNPDHVHFTREGYSKLADMLFDDLLRAWAFDADPKQQSTTTTTTMTTADH